MKFTSLSYIGIIGIILVITNLIELTVIFVNSKKTLLEFIKDQKQNIISSSGTVGVLFIIIYLLSVVLE